MLTPSQILALLRVAAVALILGAGWYGWRTYLRTVERAEAAEAALSAATATLQATEAATGALGAAQAETQRVEVVVTQSRADAARAVQELSQNDPTIAGLRATPIPDSLRDIARQRRTARDRSAGPAPGG
jgi:hypothetical protein